MFTVTALYALLVMVYDNPWVRIVLALLALNVLTGIASALYTRQFTFGALAEWLLTRALPYVLCAGSFQAAVAMTMGYDAELGQYSQWFEVSRVAIWGAVVVALIAHTIDNLKPMGVLPNLLGKVPTYSPTSVPPPPPPPPEPPTRHR